MDNPTNQAQRKVRLGMVGGGPGSNIGATHRYAAHFDERYRLVTGVFASTPERSQAFAATLDIAPDRRYGCWQEMAEAEAKRPDGMEAVTIVTPNNSHYEIAKAFLEQGIDIYYWVFWVSLSLDVLERTRRSALLTRYVAIH